MVIHVFRVAKQVIFGERMEGVQSSKFKVQGLEFKGMDSK
jgi:hypothetical protein